MANQNGMGAGTNGAMYGGGMNGSIMPSAGHYSDMQTLMQNMETLAGWLQQNREDWGDVQQGLARVERMQARHSRDGPMVNGDGQPPDTEPSEPSTSEVKTQLEHAQSRITSLERTYREQQHLQSLYEETLTDATERIRQYCFEQQNHVIALHQHYTQLLSQSRNETIEAQLTHQAWQAGLKRVSEGVREAWKSREEESRPWRAKVRGLREENRVLRKMAGWDPPPEDSDDENEAVGEGTAPGGDRGRGSVPAGGNGGAVAAVAATAGNGGGGGGAALGQQH